MKAKKMSTLKNNIKYFLKISKLSFALAALFSSSQAFSQNAPMSSDAHFRVEQKVSSQPGYHITVKPFVTGKISQGDTSSLKIRLPFTVAGKSNPSFGDFTNSVFNSHTLYKERPTYAVAINPIITLGAGADVETKDIYPDTRLGFSTVGSILSNKVSFNGNFFAGRTAFAKFQQPYKRGFGNVPFYGNYLKEDGNTFTYISSTGTVGYSPSSNFRFELGRDKSFFGAGEHSLLLSDYAAPLPFFKTTVDVWKVKYTWMLISGKDYGVTENNILPESYGKNIALHYLSLNLTDRININFFEASVSSARDSIGNKGMELTYLNPVIFYRPVEFAAGSEGNSLLGGGINVRLWESTFLYSQFILDEFILSHVKARDGWWGNKQGVQAGFKSYNFFVKNLFVLGEINMVRPFTFSHGTMNQSYGMYGEPLAHPLGANFTDATAILRYDITKRLSVKAKVILSRYGADVSDTVSYGGDIYKSYDLRPGEDPYLGNSLFQGDQTTTAFAEMKFSYLINPKWNTVFELGGNYKKISSTAIQQNNIFLFAGFKTQIFSESFN